MHVELWPLFMLWPTTRTKSNSLVSMHLTFDVIGHKDPCLFLFLSNWYFLFSRCSVIQNHIRCSPIFCLINIKVEWMKNFADDKPFANFLKNTLNMSPEKRAEVLQEDTVSSDLWNIPLQLYLWAKSAEFTWSIS